MILRLQERFKFTTVLIGKGAYEKAIGPFVNDLVRRAGKFIHFEALPEVVDKRVNAQSIRGRMRVGGVKFNKAAKWYPDFEQELLEFDRGAHDDQVDTMSYFGRYLDNMIDAPSYKEIEDMEYDDLRENFDKDDFLSGRSIITGY
jgi:predicted phage terminase large subunit-like protein